MTITLKKYTKNDFDIWEEFINISLQKTFINSRKFIEYHGNRYKDESLLIFHNEILVGLLPAAMSSSDHNQVISHPGLTYGGIIHAGFLRGSIMSEVLLSICSYFREVGYKTFEYKVIPSIYYQTIMQDDTYSLFQLGAKISKYELSSCIDLYNRLSVSKRRKRGLKKATKKNVKIVHEENLIDDLWPIIEENLKEKYDSKPVHTKDEIVRLLRLFPENIKCVCAKLDESVVSGVIFFTTETVVKAQYIASRKEGLEVCALDKLFDYYIDDSFSKKIRWFDFGTSNSNSGKELNQNLYKYKIEFGAGSVVYSSYVKDLN